MNLPLISIILPVYNGEKFLDCAIKSCVNQTYSNIEIIIINDCSTDDSLNIAKKWGEVDNRINIITNSENLKLPASLNRGHEAAQGEFITWTSDDNIFQPNAILKMLEELEARSADLVYCDYLIINEKSDIIGMSRLKPIEYLLFYGVIGACFLYRKEVYKRNSGFKENLFLVEDYDFWLRALKHSNFVKIDIPAFYYYRYHPASLTERMKEDKELKMSFLENLNKLYDELFEVPLKNKQALIDYLIDRFKNGPHNNIYPLLSKSFFEDLEKCSSVFHGLSFLKIKRIIINDCIESILKNKKYQNFKTFNRLHKVASREILRLPIERYIVLVKKVIF